MGRSSSVRFKSRSKSWCYNRMTQNINIIFKICLEYERERDVDDDITINNIQQDKPLHRI